MFGKDELSRVQGATVYDASGDKVGKVDQIYLDDYTDEPSWVTVSTGLFGTSTSFAPLRDARLEGGDVHLAYSKDQIKDAPRVDSDQHLEPDEEQELYRHYGFQDSWNAGYTTAGTTDTSTLDTDTTGTGYARTDVGSDSDLDRDLDRDRDEASMTLSEERLQVGTETREAGRARLRKYTTTETESVEVPVSKERLVVERQPASGRVEAGSLDDTDDSVEEITLREERPVVDKETVAVEEVRVGKEQVTERERVTGEVRKEQVDLDTDDVDTDVDTRGSLGDAR